MSRFAIIPARALDDSRMTAPALRVLLEFGRCADRSGWCHPKAQTIADRIGCGRSAVANQVKLLKEWGYLERGGTLVDGRPQHGYWWRVIHDADLPAAFDKVEGVSREMTPGVSRPVTGGVTPGDDRGVSRPEVTNPERTPQKNVSLNGDCEGGSKKHDPPPPPQVDGHPFWADKATLLAALRACGVPDELLDGDWVQVVDARTEGTEVCWDRSMKKWAGWYAETAPSRKPKNLRRSFRQWVDRDIEADRARRKWKEANADRGRAQGGR